MVMAEEELWRGERGQRWEIMQRMEEDRAARVGYALRSAGHGMSSEEDYRRRLAEQRSGGHRGRGPRGYRRSDERIAEDVNQRLTDDPDVDASEIEVSVANGEVTLTGRVDSKATRRLAEDIAEDVLGVGYVSNKLMVR
jgi:osmotically-inducible protein OsmY